MTWNEPTLGSLGIALTLLAIAAAVFSLFGGPLDRTPVDAQPSTAILGEPIESPCGLPHEQPEAATAMILTGVPPSPQPIWEDTKGQSIPAGCGPQAVRLLLAYYEERYGYDFQMQEDETAAVEELHDRMHTMTVLWDGERMGFTFPAMLVAGMKSYITSRYPSGVTIRRKSGSLGSVFETSVSLIQEGRPQIIAFDWEGMGWIFPCHFAVVVGYRIENNVKELIINTGWGYDFQALDMTDPAVWPATLYWMDQFEGLSEDGGERRAPPSTARGMWTCDTEGFCQLQPVVHAHFDPYSAETWRMSDCTVLFASGPAARMGISYWYK